MTTDVSPPRTVQDLWFRALLPVSWFLLYWDFYGEPILCSCTRTEQCVSTRSTRRSHV